jgi:hypothetical protein
MSEALDPLEAQLAALRPRDASAALRQRLAEHMSRRVETAPRWPWRAASAAAAVLLALNLWLALENQRQSARSARERGAASTASAHLRGRELDLTEARALLDLAGAHLTPRPDPVTLRHRLLLTKDDGAWDTH